MPYRAALSPVVRAHALALALRGRCPFCAEVTRAPGILGGTPCPVCAGRFEDEAFADRLLAEMRRVSGERFWILLAGVTLFGLSGCVLGPFALVAAVLGWLAFRAWVVQPALMLMGGARRFVAGWTLRMLFAFLLALATAVCATVPPLGAFGAPVTFAVAWWGVRAYVLWQLGQERRRQRVGVWEYALLAALALAVVGSALLALMAAYAVWELVSSIAELFR